MHTLYDLAISLLSIAKEQKCEYVSTEYIQNDDIWGFPGGTVVKNPPAKAGDTGSGPGQGRSHMPRTN